MNSDFYNLSQVTCGLVPAILKCLERSTAEKIIFHIRPGLKAEILSSFGSGGIWGFSFSNRLGYDEVEFQRKNKVVTNLRLSILNY